MGVAVPVRVTLLYLCNYKSVAGVFSWEKAKNQSNVRKYGLRFQAVQLISVRPHRRQ